MNNSSAKEAALEATEAAKEAAREATEDMRRAFTSFYSQVSCSDLSAIQAPGCTPLKGSGGRDSEGDVTLDWRADPIISLSDLTLVVYDGSAGAPYHVHTLLMAYGGRKSGFIEEQIKGQSGKGKGKKKNKGSVLRQNSQGSNSDADYNVDIYVPALAARHMPLFLDYVYGASPKLTTATAPALRYLSNRFDCRDLHKEITSRFIPRDLELNTAPNYCAMADELKDFELRDKSIRIMAERFEKMNVNLLKGLSPRMLRTLVQCDRLDCVSEGLSEKVAQYLRLRDGEEDNGGGAPLTDEDFYWLTHCQHMPKISPKEALFYFNYGAQFPQVMNEIGPGSIKARCLAASSEHLAMSKLTSHLENAAGHPLELYENLELKMKVQLLESALVGAKNAMVENEKGLKQRNERDRDVALSDELMYQKKKDRPPSSGTDMKVVVLGCGVAPANGIYICIDNTATADRASGSPNGTNISYEKEAVWKQQKVTFLLYPVPSGQYYTQYKLAVRQNGQTKVLYNSPAVLGGCGVALPEESWEVDAEDSVEELHPPPQFIGRLEQPASNSNWNGKMKRSLP
ncbi:hypothetical protein ACHAXT_008525 [Thalassiosira profunda]